MDSAQEGTQPCVSVSLAIQPLHSQTDDSMGDAYLRKCTSRIVAVAQDLVQLFQLKAVMMPNGSCMDMANDLQLYTMASDHLL